MVSSKYFMKMVDNLTNMILSLSKQQAITSKIDDDGKSKMILKKIEEKLKKIAALFYKKIWTVFIPMLTCLMFLMAVYFSNDTATPPRMLSSFFKSPKYEFDAYGTHEIKKSYKKAWQDIYNNTPLKAQNSVLHDLWWKPGDFNTEMQLWDLLTDIVPGSEQFGGGTLFRPGDYREKINRKLDERFKKFFDDMCKLHSNSQDWEEEVATFLRPMIIAKEHLIELIERSMHALKQLTPEELEEFKRRASKPHIHPLDWSSHCNLQ